MEIDSKAIIQRVEEMYRYYEVDLAFLETLDDEQKMKGLKGVLAELDLKKKGSSRVMVGKNTHNPSVYAD